jgi:hypothetical protein
MMMLLGTTEVISLIICCYPMDLAGFILELAALCKQVGSEQYLYILLSDED